MPKLPHFGFAVLGADAELMLEKVALTSTVSKDDTVRLKLSATSYLDGAPWSHTFDGLIRAPEPPTAAPISALGVTCEIHPTMAELFLSRRVSAKLVRHLEPAATGLRWPHLLDRRNQ